jgi:hypothetical protein
MCEMAEKQNHLSENIYCIFHELLVPLNILVGLHSALDNKVPSPLEEPLNLVGQISNRLHTEILAIFRDPGKKIDLQSAVVASEQLRLLSGEWMKKVEQLSQVVSQIDTKNIHLEDDLLNNILNEIVSKKGLDKLGEMLSYLAQAQAEHLTADDGFFYVLHIEKRMPT